MEGALLFLRGLEVFFAWKNFRLGWQLLDVDVALRIGDFDSVFLEFVPDCEHDSTPDVPYPVGRVVDPKPQFQIDRIVSETGYQASGFRILQGAPDGKSGI